MAGRKQNPIKDITDTVSAWLGGNRGTINPQVQRTISQTKRAAKTIDQFATGGLGAAAVADAQRMAQSGSSTPSALYKTAAVNLGAAAVGVAAAKAVGKVVSAVSSKTGRDIGIHLSDVSDLKKVTYSPERAGTGLGREPVKGQTYKFSPQIGTETEGRMTSAEFADYVARERSNLASKSNRSEKGFAYITKSKVGEIDPAYGPWSNARMVPSQRVVDRIELSTSSETVAAKRLYEALSRFETTKAANVRAATGGVGVATGLVTQQLGSGRVRKSRGSGKNKK